MPRSTLSLPVLFVAGCLALAGCDVGNAGPAPAESRSATHAADVAEIQQLATELNALATQLTVQVDESRRAVEEDRSTPNAEIDKMIALSAQVADKNDALQKATAELEERVRASATEAMAAE